MLWILRSGAPWRDLPDRYGSWSSVHDRFSLWQQDGAFDHISKRLQIRLDELGKIEWDLFCIDAASQPHQTTTGTPQNGYGA